jgi:prepilin-type N-terminal cleavage/methylation domain-containing protein
MTKSENGFSLIEVMISMAIFAFGLLAIVYGSLTFPMVVSQSSELNNAAWLVRDLSSIANANPNDLSQINGLNTKKSTAITSSALKSWIAYIPQKLPSGYAIAKTVSSCVNEPCEVNIMLYWRNHNAPQKQNFNIQVGF